MGEERYEDAETEIRAALEIEEDPSYLLYLALGNSLREQERYDEAEEVYLQALEIEDEEIDVYLALGDFYLDRNRNFDAQEKYEAALELDEESIAALIGLGYSLALQDRCGSALQYFDQARDLDPENFVASDLYNQCYQVWRYDNPPGPQGEIINEGTAVSLAKSAVVNRLGIPGDTVIAEFQAGSNGRILFIGFLATFDPNTQPSEFANQLSQAIFAATDAFVRTDSAPILLVVQAFAIQGQDIVLLGSRGVHRTDSVDWWNSVSSDSTYASKFFTP
jgi:tetratricopeptide (TPR) repeat protein